ncbi:MAG: ATP-binding protein [Candidatus Cloacimonetes bacterium]|nr:ATP-binding protein [Candidatus Cloacimonadota bacterium]
MGKVRSDLFESSATMPFEDLLKRMNLVERTYEKYYPKNVALMFFNPEPHKFFPQTQIDVVHFPDGPGGDSFSEKIFQGPLDQMLTEALSYIKSRFILEHIQKVPGIPEAKRFFNYPFQAIEEALCNAIYHRSYQEREPVEVRILPDKITIHSIPGPDHSVSEKEIEGLTFTSRRYRNRRIGEYLKELQLTEGRGTGMPKIIRACKRNGSPLPIIHTDANRSFFMFELNIHEEYQELSDQVGDQVQLLDIDEVKEFYEDKSDQVTDQVQKMIMLLKNTSLSRKEIMERLNLVHIHSFRELYLLPSIEAGFVVMTIPDKPRSINQRYKLSPLGQQTINSIHSINVNPDEEL